MDNSSGSSMGGGVSVGGGMSQGGDISMETAFENNPSIEESGELKEVITENSTKIDIRVGDADRIMNIPGTAHDKLSELSELNIEESDPVEEGTEVPHEFEVQQEKVRGIEELDDNLELSLQERNSNLQTKALQMLARNKKDKLPSEDLDELINELKELAKDLRRSKEDPETIDLLINMLESLRKKGMTKKEILLLLILFILEQLFVIGEKSVDEIEKDK